MIGMRATRSLLLLGVDPAFPVDDGDVIVVDLDTRHGPASAAAAETTRAIAALGASRQVFVKVDSLLRGHVASTVRSAGGFAVVCPALPRLGRVVRSGVVHLDGVPLHETDAWRVESTPPPRSVADLLAPQRVETVGLADVRGPGLVARLRAIRTTGAVAVCDAEDDADLHAVAAAGTTVGAVLVGSAGLAAALGRENGSPWPARTPGSGVLVVVGSAAASAQVEHLRASGAHVVPLSPSLLERPEVAVGDAVVVLAVDPAAGVEPGAARALVAALADVAADAVRPTTADLVLTGGETARAVLDRLGVTRLTVHGPLAGHHGAVLSVTPDGRRVVTRPGSFGTPGSLTDIATALRSDHTNATEAAT